MDRHEADRLRLKAKEIFQAAERQYAEDVRSIERVLALEGNGQATIDAPPQRAMPRASPKGRPSATTGPMALVREAAAVLSPGFTRRDVVSHIRKNHPKADVTPKAVSSALNKLIGKKEIKMTKPPSGQAPGTYEKIANGAREGTAP